jgi:hypothetical protein
MRNYNAKQLLLFWRYSFMKGVYFLKNGIPQLTIQKGCLKDGSPFELGEIGFYSDIINYRFILGLGR